MRAHFIDFDCLVSIDQKPWIVNKLHPNVPIHKITQSDFNLFSSGIYKSQGNKINFNGRDFWLPTDFLNSLKVKIKNTNIDISNLAISLQEFLNPAIIKNMKFELNKFIIDVLKNKNEDTYLICSKQTKNAYGPFLEKIKEELSKEGIVIKDIYYMSKTFWKQDRDDVKYKKTLIFIENMIGYKISAGSFIDKETEKYKEVEYYDNSYNTLSYCDYINDIFRFLLQKSDSGMRSIILENLEYDSPAIICNQISDNDLNKIEKKKMFIAVNKIIKTFESFLVKEDLFNFFRKKTDKSEIKSIFKTNYNFSKIEKGLIMDSLLEIIDKYKFMEIETTNTHKLVDYISRRKRAREKVVVFIEDTDAPTLIFLNLVFENPFFSEQLNVDLEHFESFLSKVGVNFEKEIESNVFPIGRLYHIRYALSKI